MPRPDAFPSYADLLQRPRELAGTAWGLFGDEDQIGTLNHLTPDRIKAAAGLVSEGLRFGLNLPLDAFDPPLISHRGAVRHEVFGLDKFHRDDRLDNFFPQASTQIDGLRHFAHPDHGFYNGATGSDISGETTRLGIQYVAAQGIVGRGLLIDVARYREAIGSPIDHHGSEEIPVSDLEATLDWQRSPTIPGDILLVRFGWLSWYRSSHRPEGSPLVSAGLAQVIDSAAWLWDRQVAAVAADNVALEAWPASKTSEITTKSEQAGSLPISSHTGMLHRILIPLLGMTIGELWDLDALADACHARRRYAAFVSAQPLNITGGVGSPANAIALI